MSDGEAAVTFSPTPEQNQIVNETQLSGLPTNVSTISANESSSNPSTGSEGLPGDGNNIVVFLNIIPRNDPGETVAVTQDVTVNVTVTESALSGIENPTLYHDVNSNGTYSELDTEVTKVRN